MSENRSGGSVVQSVIDIKVWRQQLPTVAEVRPARCPACTAPSCPVGGAIQLHGHGLRERQVRGPMSPDEAATMITIIVRRFRCVPCGAVFLVVPREVHGRRVYSAPAIAFALALWGLVLATAAEVRRRVSPATVVGDTAVSGWATLRRWARDVACGRLFSPAPDPRTSTTLRLVASCTASRLAASADPTTRASPIEHRAFLGAAHVA